LLLTGEDIMGHGTKAGLEQTGAEAYDFDIKLGSREAETFRGKIGGRSNDPYGRDCMRSRDKPEDVAQEGGEEVCEDDARLEAPGY
jgi:hypothetical protein